MIKPTNWTIPASYVTLSCQKISILIFTQSAISLAKFFLLCVDGDPLSYFLDPPLTNNYVDMLSWSQLGGVILPNDGSCKISGTTAPQDYNNWITLDYPSIGQIAQALRENEIIPIFAAQQGALPVYQVTISACT